MLVGKFLIFSFCSKKKIDCYTSNMYHSPIEILSRLLKITSAVEIDKNHNQGVASVFTRSRIYARIREPDSQNMAGSCLGRKKNKFSCLVCSCLGVLI